MLRTLADTPIVFLDFDGVLNHAGCHPETNFLQESIDVLNEGYNKIPYSIVLHTSWKNAYVFADLVNLLKEKGIQAPDIDKTPTYVGRLSDRKDTVTLSEEEFYRQIPPEAGPNKEVLEYIRIHSIQHYVILDDCYFSNPELHNHQVMTSYFDEINGGLRSRHLPELLRILSL